MAGNLKSRRSPSAGQPSTVHARAHRALGVIQARAPPIWQTHWRWRLRQASSYPSRASPHLKKNSSVSRWNMRCPFQSIHALRAQHISDMTGTRSFGRNRLPLRLSPMIRDSSPSSAAASFVGSLLEPTVNLLPKVERGGEKGPLGRTVVACPRLAKQASTRQRGRSSQPNGGSSCPSGASVGEGEWSQHSK